MPFSRSDLSGSMSARKQMDIFLRHVHGSRSGLLYCPYGEGGHFTPSGAYDHEIWQNQFREFPRDQESFIAWALRTAKRADIYQGPILRSIRSSKNGTGTVGRNVWADVDDRVDEAWKTLDGLFSQGSLVVHSGRGIQPYIRLNRWYPWEVIQDLNKLLTSVLSADSKWGEQSVLRFPGTMNHKGTAAGGEPLSVVLEIIRDSEIPKWSPEDLAEALGALQPPQPALTATGDNGRTTRQNGVRVTTPAKTPGKSNRQGDQSRSGQTHRHVAELMSQGYFDHEILDRALGFDPAQDKFGDRLEREIERCIEKLRPRHDHAGKTCQQARCKFLPVSEVVAQIEAIRVQFHTHYRCRTLSTDSKLFDAQCDLAISVGSLVVDVSQRDLCERAGIGSRATVVNGLKRLQESGYERQVLLKNGKPARRGEGPIATRSFRYRLLLPNVNTEPHFSTAPVPMAMCGPESPLDHPGMDIWRWGALGCTRSTYEALWKHPMTVDELVEMLPYSRPTVQRHLKRLSDAGLVEQTANGKWVAVERPPKEVAEELGVSGAGRKQKARHARQRQRYEAFLERNERSWHEHIADKIQIRPGVWVPRKKGA